MSHIQNLHRAGQIAHELYSGHAAKAGVGKITPRQAALIGAIAKLGVDNGHPPTQAEIGAEAGIDRSTVAEVIKRLTATGLVKRTRSKEDLRAYGLSLTAAGNKMLPKLAAAIEATNADLGARIKGLDRVRIQEAA
jgi:DNA-binding MarR family transcriptional regulator